MEQREDCYFKDPAAVQHTDTAIGSEHYSTVSVLVRDVEARNVCAKQLVV